MVSLRKKPTTTVVKLASSYCYNWQLEIWAVFSAQHVNNRNLDLKALKFVKRVSVNFYWRWSRGEERKASLRQLTRHFEIFLCLFSRATQPYKGSISHVLSCPHCSSKTTKSLASPVSLLVKKRTHQSSPPEPN